MPRPLVKKVWTSGLQDVDVLASGFFNVSRAAMTVRLRYLGLIDDPERPVREYFRSVSNEDLLTVEPDLCLVGV